MARSQNSVAVYYSKQIAEANPELTVNIIPNDPNIPEFEGNIFGTVGIPSQRPFGAKYVGTLMPHSDASVRFFSAKSGIDNYSVNIAGENAPDFVKRLFVDKLVLPVKIPPLTL